MPVTWPTREPAPIERWWEPRRLDEPVTAEFLGRVLDELGTADLAHRARLGHFDDYFAPAEVADGFELIRLVRELQGWGRGTNRVARLRARVVIDAVKRGEFDGTREEAQRWAASLDGQEALNDPVAMARAHAILQKLQDPQILQDALSQVDALIDGDGEAA
jgi:hypothetical protein